MNFLFNDILDRLNDTKNEKKNDINIIDTTATLVSNCMLCMRVCTPAVKHICKVVNEIYILDAILFSQIITIFCMS